ncbi:MAG: class F sortase [Dermatophilaceae bacterium]|nr:class F sortase [Dermatophilaceae bacterium]
MSTSSSSWGLATVVVGGVALIVVGATGGGSSASSLNDASRLSAPLPVAGAAAVAPVPTAQSMGPSTIAVPSLGMTAGIGRATMQDGELTPPLDPGVVGSWSGSAPLDAAAGEVTLTGHVNYGNLGPFAFGRLAELAPGELVYTTDAQDKQTAWRIDSVKARPKSAGVDPAAFNGTSGARQLALVTCGGRFDAASHSYEANVYVLAHSVPAG